MPSREYLGLGAWGQVLGRGREEAGATPGTCRSSLYLMLEECSGSSEGIWGTRLSRTGTLEGHTPRPG